MAGDSSKLIGKITDGTGVYPVLTTVKTNRNAGDTVLYCNDLTGWAKSPTKVHFSTYRLKNDGTIDLALQRDWEGVVSGNNITNLVQRAGATDGGHIVGDLVLSNPTAGWADDLADGILATHNADGTLKSGIVASGNIANSAVGNTKLASSAVTTAKVASNAITSDKIDWATMKVPTVSNTVIETFSEITSSRNITPSQTCFLVGKAISFNSGISYIKIQGHIVGGIPYSENNTNLQVGFCLLVNRGVPIQLIVQNGGRIQSLEYVKIDWANIS